MAEIQDLVGKTLTEVIQKSDEIIFVVNDGAQYKMFHQQDCCEGVSIDDINGDLSDLIGSPILLAEEVSNQDFETQYESKFSICEDWGIKKDSEGNFKPESYTWTFYKLATIKGYVDIRWFGESNGYYSERVNCVYVDNGYSTARGKMLSYLSKNASKGGVSMEHSKMLDHELLECYTKAVDKVSRESQKHLDLSRIHKLDKGILLPYLIKTVAEEKVDIFLLKETDNGDGTNTHILEIVSKKEEA